MKKENQIIWTENKMQFFSRSINEISTIAILSSILEGKSINAGSSKKDKDFFLELKPNFQKLLTD